MEKLKGHMTGDVDMGKGEKIGPDLVPESQNATSNLPAPYFSLGCLRFNTAKPKLHLTAPPSLNDNILYPAARSRNP